MATVACSLKQACRCSLEGRTCWRVREPGQWPWPEGTSKSPVLPSSVAREESTPGAAARRPTTQRRSSSAASGARTPECQDPGLVIIIVVEAMARRCQFEESMRTCKLTSTLACWVCALLDACPCSADRLWAFQVREYSIFSHAWVGNHVCDGSMQTACCVSPPLEAQDSGPFKPFTWRLRPMMHKTKLLTIEFLTGRAEQTRQHARAASAQTPLSCCVLPHHK